MENSLRRAVHILPWSEFFSTLFMKYYIGCSGFSYKEWKGEFYPDKWPQKKWFEFYASRYNTLELNVTFYRFPTAKMLESWYERSPEDFLFAVKAPRLITHLKRFNDTESLISDFYGLVREGLKHKLGPILFQLPAKLVYDEDVLNRIVESIDNKFINVVEFRHESWWKKEVREKLTEHRIIFCGVSHPDLPDELVVNGPDIYYRFHGVPKLYYSEYPLKTMKAMARKLQHATIKHAYIYFNNTANAAAIHNADQLTEMLKRNDESP